ncbi:insulin-like growth factor-binding protein complex acid labile subunit [Ruditapes philippinarum]|uniref:insulin-like growth factor-binding protein complex acid labile subunit n=1 Tax=Ruditapes philippinarum TaxID=129788 RepID=UPI00295BDE18|nr:insulin-like growth factor-binding protein complex acid labile subunit [Ruditapes philippinarum]
MLLVTQRNNMKLDIYIFVLWFVFFLNADVNAARYYRHSGSEGLRGELDKVQNDCPVQCRCIALAHLSYRDMAERWLSMRRMHGVQTTFKGTESPVWKEEAKNLQGRDVVCMGLNKVPRPLPNSVKRLTLFGDSSSVTDNGQTQITYIRESSFENGETLNQLMITGNNIYILYPYIFRNLPNVQHLAIQNNNISHISAAAFSSLSQLIELRLSDNMIRFLSPNVFSQLVHLEYLFLNGNKLTAMHNFVLQKLKHLQYLDLSRNNFRTFYDSVFDGAVNLQDLLMNENQIWYIRSRWFEKLSKLRRLEIRANVITRIDPSSFKTLTSLEDLHLSANIINLISNEAFRNLSRLKNLDLGTNDINKLEPGCFAGLDSLDNLDLSVNKLSFINNKTFTSTPLLRVLHLSKNSIKDVEEAALHPLTLLQELDLSYNKLKVVESKTFTGLMELKEVNLEHNIISEVKNDAFIVAPLNQLSKITWLSLQYNRIKSLNAYSLYGLPHLKFFNVGHNKLKTIHSKSFYTLISLQNLMMNNNKLSTLEDGLFTNLKLLYSLSLENNKISVISDNSFVGLRKLDDLNMKSNRLESISKNAFRHLSDLTHLHLSNNLLFTFDFGDLGLVKKLESIDLGYNRLFELKFPKHRTHTLRELILSYNQLQTLSSNAINILEPISNAYLDNNPWSCDCRLDWLPKYISEYKIRLGRSSFNTLCRAPSSLYGVKISDVAIRNFRCDNSTVSKMFMCQNLQIRYTKQAKDDIMRKSKREARNWHVSFRAEDNKSNISRVCNGILLTSDWVLTRRTCFQSYIPYNSSKVIAKVGRKESRQIALSIDYSTDQTANDFDLRLIRLATKRTYDDSETLPCILTHSQYHQLATVIPEAIFTVRRYTNETRKWKLLAKRGKIAKKCDNNGSICVRVKTPEQLNMQGSPLSLRYQGIWYLAGLGITVNSTELKSSKFTPLWTVNEWLAATIYEIDKKCRFLTTDKKTNVLCENLSLNGVLKSDKVLHV